MVWCFVLPLYSQYPMECGCGQTTAACLVMSRAPYVPAATSSRKSSAGMATDDEHVRLVYMVLCTFISCGNSCVSVGAAFRCLVFGVL